MNRDPKDVDYFSDTPQKGEDNFWHPSLADWKFGPVASLNELYTIKVSHQFWDLHGTWDKHQKDIILMQKHGAKLIPDLFKILYKIWEETHGKKKANLELEPEEFFNKNVTRTYEHDSIHASVAYFDEPMFNRILRDGHKVAVDKAKWDVLPLDHKDMLVREEAYATALERKIIPNNYEFHRARAYMWALKKTITSFSKGWFPLYIVENFDRLRQEDLDYVELHKSNAHLLVEITS